MKVNIPVYNSAGLRELARLSPFLRSGDTLMLVSGNVDRPLDLGWVDESLSLLERYREQTVLVATAGHAHLERLAAAKPRAAGLAYIYEPGFQNVPEFAWEADTTVRNLVRAVATTRAAGFQAVFKPTGRPLFQANLARYGWDYGVFAEGSDALLVQTQTYCHKGNFDGAVAKLGLECAAQLGETYVQVTLDLAARNGVSPAGAVTCARVAADHGFAGVTVWWSPRYTAEAVAFLEGRP